MFPCAKISSPAASAAAAAVAGAVRSVRRGEGDRSAGAASECYALYEYAIGECNARAGLNQGRPGGRRAGGQAAGASLAGGCGRELPSYNPHAPGRRRTADAECMSHQQELRIGNCRRPPAPPTPPTPPHTLHAHCTWPRRRQ